MALSWFKRLFKGSSFLRNGTDIVKVVDSAGSVIKASRLSGFANTVRQLPVVRIIAGSALGVMIIDAWNGSKDALESTFGLSGDGASLVLGVGLTICLALVVSAVILIIRRD